MRQSGRAYEEPEDGGMNGRVVIGIVLAGGRRLLGSGPDIND